MEGGKMSTRVIKGMKYYTATYYANKTKTTIRTAYNHLKKYEDVKIPGHSIPKIYTEETIKKAIDDYFSKLKISIEDFEDKQEEKRAEEELNSEIEWQTSEECAEFIKEQRENPTSKEALEISEEVKEEYNEQLIIRMLESILYLQNYEFNKELLREDIEYHKWDSCREPGTVRDRATRKALKRLQSNNYLVKLK